MPNSRGGRGGGGGGGGLLCVSVSVCVRATKFLQSCPALFPNPVDSSPRGSCVHGILQAKMLEWVAMPSSRGIFPIHR